MAQISKETAFLVASWLESLLYGIFCCMFFGSLWFNCGRSKRTRHMIVMLGVLWVMFLLATFHVGTNCYQIINAYTGHLNDAGGPRTYMDDLAAADRIIQVTLYATQSILGDAVAVYRCYLVWNRCWRVVVAPVILIVISAVTGYVAIGLHTSDDHSETNYSLEGWISSFYATAVVQNLITTGLISWKIWSVENMASSHRATSSRNMPVLRILVESAVLYLLAQILLLAFFLGHHNAQQIMLQSIPPIVGITFSAIMIRITLYAHRTFDEQDPGTEVDVEGGMRFARGGSRKTRPVHMISVSVSKTVEDDALRSVISREDGSHSGESKRAAL